MREGDQFKYWKQGTSKAVNLTLLYVGLSTQKINRISDCTKSFLYRRIYMFHCGLKHSKCLHFPDQEQTCISFFRLKLRPYLKGMIAVALTKSFQSLPTYKFGEFKRNSIFQRSLARKGLNLIVYILQVDYNKYIQFDLSFKRILFSDMIKNI